MNQNIFANFELIKLNIKNPDLINCIILFIYFICSIITFKRINHSTILDKSQTNQLKGIAILVIISGHLWAHVSQNKAALLMQQDAVTLFLLMSGFGLTISSQKKHPAFKEFFSYRLKRIMVPYWITTIIILSLDYIFLDRVYQYKDIIATVLGFNISLITERIDYVRWYITYQLFWYFVFYFVILKIQYLKPIKFIIICSILVIIFRYCTKLGDGSELAFPIGCLIGKYYDNIKIQFNKNKKLLTVLALLLLIITIFYKISVHEYIEKIPTNNSIARLLQFSLERAMLNISHLSLSVSVILIIAAINEMKYCSAFLNFCGKVSYELFLIHGCVLIKYNPIFKHLDVNVIILSYFLLLVLLLFLSYYLNKFNNYVKNK